MHASGWVATSAVEIPTCRFRVGGKGELMGSCLQSALKMKRPFHVFTIVVININI